MTKNEIRDLVGKNIRKERIARNISTDELASLLGHTPSSIGLIERGERGTSAFVLYNLSKIFGLPTEEFFSADSSKPESRNLHEKLTSLISDFSEEEAGFMIYVAKGLRDLRKA
ncbi:MAG: helix-turn-helix domain-containing protein [Clostridiales bacterium]|jgi:transcriptional regulator with XRE-family HTH domain|nr:helix-turn-helix domain-containing protein [Clostridiales bacterium]